MSNEFNNAEKIQEIAKFAAKASGFDLDSIDGETIQLSTRANGDVGSETPGKEDIRTAFAAAREIHERFPQANCSIDTVDEWTNLAVEIHDRPLPTSPIGGGTLQKNLREAALELAKDALLGLVPSGPCIYVPSTGIGVTLMPFGSTEWRKIIRHPRPQDGARRLHLPALGLRLGPRDENVRGRRPLSRRDRRADPENLADTGGNPRNHGETTRLNAPVKS